MFKIKLKDNWLERRVIWMAGGETPTDVQKPPEKIDAAKEKLDAAKMDEIAGRIKTLDIARTKIGDGKNVDVYQFKQALKAKLQEGGDKSLEKTLNVKNLDVYLMNGLLENLGKADAVPTKIDPKENTELTKWLKDKKVAQFAIKDGFWAFYDNGNPPKAVQDDYKLDDQDAKDKGQPGAKAENAVLSTGVKKLKDQEKADADAAAKAEVERVKPDNLEKVNSDKPVPLDAKMTIADLTKPLEQSTLDTNKKPRITSAEIQKALSKYIAESLGDNSANPQITPKQFSDFMKLLIDNKYTEASIVNGKIVFKGPGIESSNPSNLQKPKEGGGTEPRETWAHESLQGRALEKKQTAEKTEAVAKSPKPTPLDGTEADVAKLISGKEAPTDKDLANVDQRYLPALQNILSYNDGGPVNLSIPFNDSPLDCQFYKTGRGTYVLAWEGGKNDRFTEYNPKEKGPAGLKEAQKYFVNTINSGQLLQQIQANNIKAKGKFEEKGMVVDDGPKILPGGAVKYEFDWATGLGGDPDVTIRPLPHGALSVLVEQSDVALDGSKKYEFVAGGFQDMTRTLKTLQKYAEAPDTEKANMKSDEADRRFLAQGKDVLQLAATPANAGKILRIDSVKAFNVDAKFSETNMKQGYKLDFDWMQKLQPPQNLRIYKVGDSYALNLQPSNQDIGYVKPPLEQNFGEAMKMVASQREYMTTQGGEKLMGERVQKLLDVYNGTKGKLEFAAGVKIAAESGGIVYLAREGMAARKFDFNFAPGIDQAANEGYLVAKGKALSALDKPGEKPQPPEKPLDNVSPRLTLAPGATERPPEELPIDRLEKGKAVDAIIKNIYPAHLDLAKQYLETRMLTLKIEGDSETKIKEYSKYAWKALADYANVKIEISEDVDSKAVQKRIIDKVNGNNFQKEVETKLQDLPGYDKIKDLPGTKSFVKGLIDNLDNVSIFDTGMANKPEQFAKAKQAYIDGLAKLIQDIFAAKDYAKKPGELNATYDQRIRTAVWSGIRLPENFIKDYGINEDKKVVWDKYQQDQKGLDAEQKDFDTAKNNPHLMSFADFSKETMAGVGPDALRIMQQNKSLDMSKVYLARTPGNTPVNQNVIRFNVTAGQAPDQIPITVAIFKQNGVLKVGAANGWNNLNYEASKGADAGPDPVKDLVDDVVALGVNERMSMPIVTDVPKVTPDVPKGPELERSYAPFNQK